MALYTLVLEIDDENVERYTAARWMQLHYPRPCSLAVGMDVVSGTAHSLQPGTPVAVEQNVRATVADRKR